MQTLALSIHAAILIFMTLICPSIAVAQNTGAVVYGTNAGIAMTNSPYAAAFGNSAGEQLSNAAESTVVGASAGRYANNSPGAIFLGVAAGYWSRSVNYSFVAGYAAGREIGHNNASTGNTYSQILGYAAAEYADDSHYSNFIGMHAGYRANASAESVMIGKFAGAFANNSPQSVMIGPQAGGVYKVDADPTPSAGHVTRGIYIGAASGKDSSSTTDVVLIGTNTKADAGVENAIALGTDAHATASNSMNVPVLKRTGGGVLVVDDSGNITSSDQLAQALAAIADLQARITALEGR